MRSANGDIIDEAKPIGCILPAVMPWRSDSHEGSFARIVWPARKWLRPACSHHARINGFAHSPNGTLDCVNRTGTDCRK